MIVNDDLNGLLTPEDRQNAEKLLFSSLNIIFKKNKILHTRKALIYWII